MGNSSNTASNTASNQASNSATNFGTQAQQQTASNTQANYGQTSGPTQAALNLINQSYGPISSSAISGYMSPYLSQVVNATMGQQQLTDTTQQQALKGNAISQGALGGDRSQYAMADLMRGQGLNDASTIANLYNTGYGQALTAAQSDRSAALQAAGMMGTQTMGTSNSASAGTTQAQTVGTQNTASAGATSGAGSSSTVQSPGIGQYAGLAASALMMMSDRRAKDDVKVIGKTFDGQPIYKFRYKGEPQMQIGLMAQDVEKVHPDAVGSVGGLKAVNYDAATKDAARRKHFADGGGARQGYDAGGSILPNGGIPAGFGQLQYIPVQMYQAPQSSVAKQSNPSIEQMQKLGSSARSALDKLTSSQSNGGGGTSAVDSGAGAAGSGAGAAGSDMGTMAGKGSGGAVRGFASGGSAAKAGTGASVAGMPNVPMSSVSMPSMGAMQPMQPLSIAMPSVSMPSVPQAWVPQASAGKGSGGAVRGFADGGDAGLDSADGLDWTRLLGGQSQAPAQLQEDAPSTGMAALAYAPAELSTAQNVNNWLAKKNGEDEPYPAETGGRSADELFQSAMNLPNAAAAPAPVDPGAEADKYAGPMDQTTASAYTPDLTPAVSAEGVTGNYGMSPGLGGLASLSPPSTPQADLSALANATPAPQEQGQGIGAPAEQRQGPAGAVNISGPLESGERNPLQGVANISPDTNGSHSYGNLGLNSQRGASMWQFQKEYGEQFGLTAAPGTREFDNQWRAAAMDNGKALTAAESEYWQKHIASPTQEKLTRLGLPDELANDPRVLTYMADRQIQQGEGSTINHGQRIRDAADGANNAKEFLENLSEADKAHLPGDFRTYLGQHPGNVNGLVNRIDNRLSASLGIDASPVTAPVKAVGSAIEDSIGALGRGAGDVASSAGSAVSTLGDGLKKVVSRGFDNSGDQPQHPIRGSQDQMAGGLMKDIFGVNFNPLNLTEKQRMTALSAFATMAQTGNIGAGINAGIAYQSGQNQQQRQATLDAMNLNIKLAELGKPQVMGEEIDPNTGQAHKIYGTPNMGGLPTPTWTKTGVGAAGTAAAPNYLAPEVSAEDAVKMAPPMVATLAKKYANYEMPPATVSRKNPVNEQAIALAEKINPGFSQQEYKTQQALKISYGSGKDSQVNASIGQALMHMNNMYSHVGDLRNTKYPAYNAVANAIAEQTGDVRFQKAAASFSADKTAAIEELTKAFKGTGGSLTEVQMWEKEMSSAGSPEALEATIKEGVSLLDGRMEVQADKQNRVLHTTDTGYNLLPPKGKAAYDALTGAGSAESTGPRKAGAAVPAVGAIYKGYRFKGGDPAQVSSWAAQ